MLYCMLYQDKADEVFKLMIELKNNVNQYRNSFILSLNENSLNTIPTQAKQINKTLNKIKSAAGGLPKKAKQYYESILTIDNVKEMMVEDIKYLANTHNFQYDEELVNKRFKKG